MTLSYHLNCLIAILKASNLLGQSTCLKECFNDISKASQAVKMSSGYCLYCGFADNYVINPADDELVSNPTKVVIKKSGFLVPIL